MKKLTFKYIQNYFKEHNCKLLETEYINAFIKMKYICSCRNESKITWNNFQQGKRCRKCSGSEKLTLEYVQNYFREQKCKLLEPEYINSSIKMKYICSCGNESKISWNNFRKGHRCKKCQHKKIIRKKSKLNYEYVFNFFKERECILLETEYINSKTKMKYICSCGNISKISLSSFKKGSRCKKCGINKCTGKNHHKWNPDREYIKNNNIISKRCGSMLKNLLNKLHIKKISKTENYLGYSRQQLYDYLTTHPSWNNVKDIKWDIDHIFPVSAFIKNNIFDIKLINSLDNLQPLEHIENMKKGDRYNKEEFCIYLLSHGYKINNNSVLI